MISQIVQFDKLIDASINIGKISYAAWFAISATIYLVVGLLIATVVYFYINKKRNKKLELVLIGMTVLFFVVEVIKRLVGRIRPNGELFSFPSRHAAFAFFIALSLPVKKPVYKVLLIAWAVLVSVSRILLHKHYLSDVVFGIGFGVLAVFVLKYFEKTS